VFTSTTLRGGRLRGVARAAVVAGALVAGLLTPTATASADPGLPSPGIRSADGSELLSVTRLDDRRIDITVRSAAMDRVVPLSVILPRDRSKPRPVLYLLNGAGGGEDAATWQRQTDVVQFFADKDVSVVTPNSGAFTYYTDWQKDDPVLGRNKWSTFLGTELPPIIDTALNGSGRNAVAGISSSGTSVLNLGIEHPGVYQAVGAYSGCAATASPLGQAYVRLVVSSRGGSDPENMWGPYSGQGWRDHDAIINAAKLRGLSLWISSASGLPGEYDTPAKIQPGTSLDQQILLGGPIEAAVNQCTHQLADRLRSLKIPFTGDFPPQGTHSWLYWQDQLHRSWPQIGRAIGA
jgi:S-formylglutathione hydrolase FrmB